jgi:hypothetical protein
MPPYNPAAWNDNDGIQLNNNCYDYCRNLQNGNFTQPGEAHGWNLTDNPYECDEVSQAAMADGLTASTGEGVCQSGCWKVALVIDPDPVDSDFHWYRQDVGGMWSHKPGQTAVTDHDYAGHAIADPRLANRGPYTEFCGYFCTCAATEGEPAREEGTMARVNAESRPPRVQMLLYAGRANPSIGLDEAQLQEVARLLEGLSVRSDAPAGGLGYSGCVVRDGDQVVSGMPPDVRAFNGAVTVTAASGDVTIYEDQNEIERWLLALFKGSDVWEAAARRIEKTSEPGRVATEMLES